MVDFAKMLGLSGPLVQLPPPAVSTSTGVAQDWVGLSVQDAFPKRTPGTIIAALLEKETTERLDDRAEIQSQIMKAEESLGSPPRGE